MTATIIPIHLAPTLDVLADRIRANEAIVEAAEVQKVEAMIALGHDLIEARALIPTGQLDAWAKAEVGMHPKTVRTYIKFAVHAEILRDHQPNGTYEARMLLAEVGVPRLNSADALKARCKALKKNGMTNAAIGKEVGVSGARVSQLLNSEAHRKRNAQAQRKRQAAAKALARETQAAQVKKAGNKNASEAYSLVRKALQELDRAMGTMPASKHKYLRLAQDEMYRAQDNIALALNTD